MQSFRLQQNSHLLWILSFLSGESSATTQIYQFLDRERWRRHIDDHIAELAGCKATKCPHPRPKCVEDFTSILELKFHLQDVHCIEFTKEIKRQRWDSEEETMPASKEEVQTDQG